MTFNVRLKQLRQKHKLTQSELADILGLKPTAISNYESKRNEPSFDKLIALSKYFDISCENCCSSASFGIVFEDGTAAEATKAESIEAWNRRADAE